MSIENIQIIETVSLDFYNNNIKTINVKQLDTDARGVKVNCTEHGKKFKLDPLSYSAFVRYKKPDGNDVLNDCYIQDDGSIVFPLTQQMTVVAGKSKLDILIFCKSGLKVEDIGDITNFNDLGISTLSTMILGLNISPNATNLEKVESSHEYNALINGLAAHVATEKHMEELDATLNKNEEQRKTNELERKNAEVARQKNETSRIANEDVRIESENKRIEAELKRQDDITGEAYRIANEQLRNEAEIERQTGEFGETYRQENEQLRIEAENKRQDSVTGETYRIANEQKRIQIFNEKIEEYDQTIEDKISEYDEKVETVLADSNIVFIKDIANNLDTEEEGKVLDATQGKVLNDNIKVLKDNISNSNLFINGNFQIWTNGESFRVQNKNTEVVTPFITADKWYVESVDSAEELNVNKVNDGLYISSSTPQECAIYQLLDDETYNAIKYKTLTLSYEYTQPYSAEDTSVHYETHKEVKQIVAEETLAWEFANNNAIRLPVGTVGGAGCTLHWVKLEIGELDTPCIPDSKDALICNLENRVRKTMHLTITDTVSTWGNINLNIDASDYIVKSIYNSDNIYIALPYVSSSGKWSANIRTNSYGSTDFVCPVGETLTLEVYCEEIN